MTFLSPTNWRSSNVSPTFPVNSHQVTSRPCCSSICDVNEKIRSLIIRSSPIIMSRGIRPTYSIVNHFNQCESFSEEYSLTLFFFFLFFFLVGLFITLRRVQETQPHAHIWTHGTNIFFFLRLECIELIQQCLAIRSSERPSLEECLQSTWLKLPSSRDLRIPLAPRRRPTRHQSKKDSTSPSTTNSSSSSSRGNSL